MLVCFEQGGKRASEKRTSYDSEANKPSPSASIPLTPIHFGVTLTAKNFTSEAFKDSICPLFISKETRHI